ncbi:conserved protein, unknown function [Hepatocystis sp. ex Piliocolobus tephrosceles]|nr:conserved protein, unknown function [Hepatocystis sp. ex Piliocolobus tephrosceles]
MKLTISEKKVLLEALKNRMLKIESVVGDIKFYDKQEKNNEKKWDNNETNLNGVEKGIYKHKNNENMDENNSTIYENKNKDTEEFTNQSYTNQINSSLKNISSDLLNTNKEELIAMIEKHKYKNSISIHICIIKFILQQISQKFLCDIYNQYNDFYIYIHSNSILDVYNTFEYKRNIILSHLDFMKSYSSQIEQIAELKKYINSYKMSETDTCLNRLNKIESKNELLFSKIATINSCLENVAYKYALMVQLASLIITKNKTNIS